MSRTSAKLARASELRAAGRLEEAEQLCRDVLNADPDSADACLELGRVLGQRGDLAGGRAFVERGARLRPGDAEIAEHLRHLSAVEAFQRAVLLAQREERAAAIVELRRATEAAPEFAEAHLMLGTLLAVGGQYDEAIACFRRTIELEPSKVAAHYNLGLALQNQKRIAEAEPHYRRAIDLDPQNKQAWNHLALVLDGLDRGAEAESAYQQALAIDPNFSDAEYNYSGLLLAQGRYGEAESRARHVLSQRPQFGPAQYNLATALADQRKLAEAEAAYRRMLELVPDYADAHLGLAFTLLLEGKYAEGWAAYEARLTHPDAQLPSFAQPRWRGEPVEGRTVLLHAEQGFGDAIQFVRYAELVKQRGAKVVVALSEPLARLLATCPWVDEVVSRYDALPPFDVQVPLLSLPGIFGTTLETIPAHVPYLFPDPAEVARWRDELAGDGRLKVGVVWQGSPRQKRDHVRSPSLAQFTPLARIDTVRWFSLQVDVGREQLAGGRGGWRLVDLGGQIRDFHDTAAIMRNLDLVISCDSAPAHLAGALGVPVWVALAYAADWRWFLHRTDSPWYPSARLFRQPRPGDWPSVFAEIAAALSPLAAART